MLLGLPGITDVVELIRASSPDSVEGRVSGRPPRPHPQATPAHERLLVSSGRKLSASFDPCGLDLPSYPTYISRGRPSFVGSRAAGFLQKRFAKAFCRSPLMNLRKLPRKASGFLRRGRGMLRCQRPAGRLLSSELIHPHTPSCIPNSNLYPDSAPTQTRHSTDIEQLNGPELHERTPRLELPNGVRVVLLGG